MNCCARKTLGLKIVILGCCLTWLIVLLISTPTRKEVPADWNFSYNDNESTPEWTEVGGLETFCPNRTLRPELCLKPREDLPCKIMTVNVKGRLGNLMGEYATLYVLSRWNGRQAFMLQEMSKVLREYFEVTMPSLDDQEEACFKQTWANQKLDDWMVDSYKSFDVPTHSPIQLTGYPCSWTFYNQAREEILREFTLKEHIVARAQRTLRSLLGNRRAATFVGVHARRSDYVPLMATEYRGVVADTNFYAEATNYFRWRYSDAIFVVASDDMEWCRRNINNSLGDVFFSGVGNITEPIHDFALLSQCNHSIIAIGTYGYWAAYLAGGETVYLTNFTLPDSPFLKVFHYETAYLPSWMPIAADLSTISLLSDTRASNNPPVWLITFLAIVPWAALIVICIYFPNLFLHFFVLKRM